MIPNSERDAGRAIVGQFARLQKAGATLKEMTETGFHAQEALTLI